VVDSQRESAVIRRAFDKLHEVALHAILLLIQSGAKRSHRRSSPSSTFSSGKRGGAQTLRVTTAARSPRPISTRWWRSSRQPSKLL